MSFRRTSHKSAPNLVQLRQRTGKHLVRFALPAISTTTKIPLFTAECNLKILSMQFVPQTTLASDGTNYWQVGLRNETDATDIVAAASATIKNSAAALTAFTNYEHDITDTAVDAGDVVVAVFTKNASAVTIAAGAIIEVLYEDN